MATAMQALQKCLNQSSVRSMRSEHKLLERLSKKYRHFPHHEIIFHVLQDTTDQLSGCDNQVQGRNGPVCVEDLKNIFENRWRIYQQLYISYGKEIGREHRRLKKELEPMAIRLICAHAHNEKGEMAINFSSIDKDLPIIQKSSLPKPIKKVLSEIGISRGFIKDYIEEATLRRTQVETFIKWRKSQEFDDLLNAYGRLRKESIRNARRTKAMNAVVS